MNIKGPRYKELDTDLLGQLALKQQSGSTISKTEVNQVLTQVRSELRDEFSHSSRGLTAAGRAVTNTLQFAVDQGWVRGETAAQMIDDFLEGNECEGLDDILKDIRSDNRRQTRRYGYGGSSTRVSRSYTRRYSSIS